MTQSSSQTTGGIQSGDIVAGKYRIDEVIGTGGMGVVVAAHHLQLDEKVAIKMLLPEVLGNAEAVARFAREARAAVKIKSEHMTSVSDVGTLENGSPYMVMEFLDGRDLGAWLRDSGPLDIEQAVEFILQACEAIAEAHGLGIVHRDLKPSNLFCVRRSDGLLSIKVLDFGISKVTGLGASASDLRLTSTSSVFGSPLYMSPEQMLSSRNVDARTDIWALGTILYELLVCRSPFDGETMPEVFAKISTQPPPPIRDRRPDAPLALEAVILKCLEKDRNNRYANVAELAIALAPFTHRRARSSVERISRVIQTAGLSASSLALPPSSMQPSAPPGADTMAPLGHTKPDSRRKPVVLLAATVVALVAGLGGLFFWLQRPGVKARVEPSAVASLGAVAVAASTPPPVASSTLSPAPLVIPAAAKLEPTVGSPAAATVPIAAATAASTAIVAKKPSAPKPTPDSVKALASPSVTASAKGKKSTSASSKDAKTVVPSHPPTNPAPAGNANNWGGRL